MLRTAQLSGPMAQAGRTVTDGSAISAHRPRRESELSTLAAKAVSRLVGRRGRPLVVSAAEGRVLTLVVVDRLGLGVVQHQVALSHEGKHQSDGRL